MNHRQRWTLGRQAFILGLLPALLMFFALVLFFTHSRLQEARQEMVERGQLIADQLAPSLEFDLITGNHDTLQRRIDPLMKIPIVAGILIAGSEGQLLLRRGKPGESAAAMPSDLTFTADILQGTVNLVSEDALLPEPLSVQRPPALLGQVLVTLDPRPLYEQQQRILFQSFSVGLLLLVFTYLLVRIMAGSLTRPVRDLTQRVESIAEGRYDGTAVNARADELQRLARAVERLSLSLREAGLRQEAHLRLLQEARQQAESASAAKSEFLTLMNHELKTPVNGLLGMLQLLQETRLDEPQFGILRTALHAGEHLNSLLSDLLTYASLEGSRLDLNLKRLNLNDLLNSLATIHEPLASAKGLAFSIEFEAGLAPTEFLADAVKVRQILNHLIDNAIKFTDRGEVRVEVRFTQEASRQLPTVECRIIDTGPGMTEAQQATAFKAFQQGHSGLRRSHGGSGLGLAIVARLVELMQGSVALQCRPGEGCCVTVRLPLVAAQVETIPEASLINRRVLVVEDNPVNMKITCGLLQTLGLQFDQAFNGLEAVTRYRTESYDLVLMDCQMPHMDGFEATREIRQLEAAMSKARVPVIAITANAEDGLAQSCLDAGMDGWLCKPFQKQQLSDLLRRWVCAS